MDKQIGVYLSNEIPLINNKEWTTDTQNNMNVSPKHPIEWKKPNKKRHFMSSQEWKKTNLWWHKLEGGGDWWERGIGYFLGVVWSRGV